MKLKHITFTGIDTQTDISRLEKIQERWPLAEFGVLTSYNWYENGRRYLNPQFFSRFWGSRLNLSLHICGSAAHDAACGLWNRINKHTIQCLPLFKRVQINVATRSDNPRRVASTPNRSTELIIQQRDRNNTGLYNRSVWLDGVSMLLDASGGRGIDTPIDPLPGVRKVGYAGGITPENVADKLAYLMANCEYPGYGEYWIDMESGVRTDEWFDLDKVEQVLTACEEVYKQY